VLPDLILLDIAMPVRMAMRPAVPSRSHVKQRVSCGSFYRMQDAQLEVLAKSVGAAKVVRKPFVDQVFQAIDEILGPQ